MRASQPVPDKEPGQPPPQQSYRGRTTKDKPQPPQASSQHRKREGRTQGKIQENIRYLDHPMARVRVHEPKAVTKHERLRNRRPEAHPP